ncbi:MAG: phage terminase large subunit family protein [Rhodobacteraceae bacterium]|nr:phage terminase large subunit family protein [Paracoccaceae bacterium]
MAKKAKTIEVLKSDFAESFLHLNGHLLSLDDYPHLRAIYNSQHKKLVLQFSRQTAKSTTLANMMITNSVIHPYFKTLYISPSVDQTKVFSHDRVNPALEGSPFLKQHYLSTSLVQNVFMKQLLNGSRMYLRYAYLDADRIRGYSADMCLFDEMQDQLEDNIGVIEETMSRSLHKRSMYVGTPKRTIGPLADRWDHSTQNEWMSKCSGCNK